MHPRMRGNGPAQLIRQYRAPLETRSVISKLARNTQRKQAFALHSGCAAGRVSSCVNF